MVKAWRVLSAFALLAAIACGDDDGSGPTGSISVTAIPTSLTLAQGASGTVTVTLARGGGFSQPVNVAVEGLPAGVTAVVLPTQLTGTTTSAIVTVNVASTVPAGTYPITVRASATGVGAATATYSLTVTAVATPNYSLSAAPAAVSAAPGAAVTSTIGIQRTSFTGAIVLTLDNPPAGITGSFNPTPATADQSVLTINVGSTVAPGSYNLTVKGSATGPGDKTTTIALTVTAPAANFTISATPAAVNLAAGASGNTSVAIVRTNFTTDVALSLVSPPAGITGVFTPATLTGTTLTSTLALTVAGSVAAGTYPITVQGVGGSLTRTAVVNVTVTAASSVSLSIAPTTLTIQQGASGQATLTATRTNFTGDIALSFTGAPTGMTVTFNPTSITGANLTSTATVSVGSGVAAGTYNITITGAAGAAGSPTTPLSVTVTAPAGGNIIWEFCNSETLPAKFWRLSNGTWAEVTATVVGNVTRFPFTASGNNAGIAFTTTASGATTTFVMYAVSSELTSLARVCTSTTAPVSKTFTVTGMSGSEIGALGYGPGAASLTSGTSSYNVSVPAGTYDWLAAFGPQPSLPTLTQSWTHYRIGRGEAAPGATVAINRANATSFVTMPVTLTGGASGSIYSFAQIIQGSRGNILSFGSGSPTATANTGTLYFLAAGDRLSSDMNIFLGTGTDGIGSPVSNSRTTIQYLGSAPPASASFALPSAVPAFTVTQVSGAPTTTWTVAGSIPAEYQTGTSSVTATTQGSGGTTLMIVSATRAWLVANGMSTSYTLTGPTLPGFQQAWAPAAPLASTTVTMAGSNITGTPVAGSVAFSASRTQQ